jgi:hypothetical protein
MNRRPESCNPHRKCNLFVALRLHCEYNLLSLAILGLKLELEPVLLIYNKSFVYILIIIIDNV